MPRFRPAWPGDDALRGVLRDRVEFKERSPLKPAFMVELAHGYLGYLPTPRQHRLGGYETWLGANRLEPSASDKLLGELLEMAAEVARPAPTPSASPRSP